MAAQDYKFVILCAGDYAPWKETGVSKFFAEVDGKANILRTQAMLAGEGVPPGSVFFAVSDPEFLKAIPGARAIDAGKTEIVCETINNVQAALGGNMVFLLGDVIYSRACILAVVDDDNDLRFFGRVGASRFTSKKWGEIFAVKCSARKWADLSAALQKTIEFYRTSHADYGRLWTCYHYLTGTEPLQNRITSKHFTQVDDLTDDFDSYKEYQRLLNRMRAYSGNASLGERVRDIFIPQALWRWKRLRYSIKAKAGFPKDVPALIEDQAP